MPRRRLGVALVLDPLVAGEVDGLRRALDDRSRDRVAPHLTLVPPVNVAEAALGDALARLHDGAASVAGPLELQLGPPATFLPDNPVLYLPVAGDLDGLTRIRQAVFTPPLARTLSWPWVPHVTIADEADPERIGAACAALGGFEVVASFDRVVLLEERRLGPARRWVPAADAVLGPRQIVGRGGLELELTSGSVLDPEAAAMLRALPERRGGEDAGPELGGRRSPFPLVCTARREQEVVGVGAAWWSGWQGHLGVAVAADHRGQGVGSHLLARVEAGLAAAGWDGPPLAASEPAGFYRGRSRTAAW